MGFSAALVLVPQLTGEVFLNLTNIQWPLALLLPLTILQDEASGTLDRVRDGLIVVLVGLSTPMVVLIVPLVWLWMVVRRSMYSAVLAFLASAVAGIQMLTFLRQPTYVPPSPDHTAKSWLELLGSKTLGNLFLGMRYPYELPAVIVLMVGSIVVLWIVWRLTCVSGSGWNFALPTLGFAFANTTLIFYKFHSAANLLVPPAAATRYFYILWVVLSWCLILLVQKDKSWARISSAGLLLLILYSSLSSVFRSPPLADYHWSSYAETLEARRSVEIPIHPTGWTIAIDPEVER